MADIGKTVRLNGAYKSVPSVPGNGQEGTATNDIAFSGTSIQNNLLSYGSIPSFPTSQQSHKVDGTINLPVPVSTYYSLAANLTIGNVREYWTDLTPSFANSPSGGGAYDSSTLTILGTYSITGSIGIPIVTSVSPVVADPTLATNLAIYGSDFEDGATVTINGVAATSVVVWASNTITCTTPVIGTVGSVSIVITNPNTKSSGTSGNGFLTTLAAPTVTSITPSTGIAGTSITDLHGTDFYPGATVTICGDAAINVVYVSSVKLTCTLGSNVVTGTGNVVVTNITGQTSGTSGNGLFTATFTPSTLNLTMWEKGPFSSLPLAGTASAGTSSSFKIGTYSVDPTVGASLNGIAGAYYKRAGVFSNSRILTTGGSPVTAETIVANSDYTISFLVNILSAGKHNATPYQAPQFLCADAHWGWGFSCDAAMQDTNDVTFDGTLHTITRTSGNWSTDGWVNGQPIKITGTSSNDGTAGGATVTGVTALTLTLSGGLTNETITGTAINVGITSGGRVNVFHYTGSFPFVSAACSVGLHWIYIRHTGATTQIDIDGVSGTAQAHPDHIGSSGISLTTNVSSYVTGWLGFTEYEKMALQANTSDATRDNYKGYLNATYGTSF